MSVAEETKKRLQMVSEQSCCVFCGSSGAIEPVVFSDTYTAFQFLQAGECACSRCAAMFRDPKFRRLNFVLKGAEFIELEDPLAFLDCPSVEVPFVLYLTRQHRKHGWVLAVQNPVLNLDKFVLIVDEDRLLFERGRYEEFRRFSLDLFERGVPRKVLLGGYPWASVVRKYGLSYEECLRLRDIQRDRLWRLCVEFRRRNNKKSVSVAEDGV